MELRNAELTAYFEDLKDQFNDALTSPVPVWTQVAMRIDSKSETNIYGWAEQLPQFREWKGTRVFHNLVSNAYSLENLPFEFSLEIHKNKLDDDQYGLYSNHVQQAGDNGAYFHDKKTFALMNNGFSTTNGACWDTKAFFANDHPWKPDENGDATILDNLSDLALSDGNFETNRARIKQNLQGGDNPFMSKEPDLKLIVGTALESTGARILNAEFNELGATNVNKGTATLMVNAQLDADKWILQVTNNPILPFIVQVREEITIDDNLGSVDIRETKFYKLMADGRFAYGYSLPVLALGSTGAA